MDLEKLQELADSDLKINDTELDLESLKTPQLHNKYMKHLTKFKLMLSRAEGDLANTKRELWEYYTGKADASVYAKKPFNFKLLRQPTVVLSNGVTPTVYYWLNNKIGNVVNPIDLISDSIDNKTGGLNVFTKVKIKVFMIKKRANHHRNGDFTKIFM